MNSKSSENCSFAKAFRYQRVSEDKLMMLHFETRSKQCATGFETARRSCSILSVISKLVERSRVERRFCGFIFGPGRRSSRRDCPELFSRRVEGRRLGSHWKKVSLGRGLARMGFRWKGVSLGCGLVGFGWGGTGQLSRNSFRFNSIRYVGLHRAS